MDVVSNKNLTVIEKLKELNIFQSFALGNIYNIINYFKDQNGVTDISFFASLLNLFNDDMNNYLDLLSNASKINTTLLDNYIIKYEYTLSDFGKNLIEFLNTSYPDQLQYITKGLVCFYNHKLADKDDHRKVIYDTTSYKKDLIQHLFKGDTKEFTKAASALEQVTRDVYNEITLANFNREDDNVILKKLNDAFGEQEVSKILNKSTIDGIISSSLMSHKTNNIKSIYELGYKLSDENIKAIIKWYNKSNPIVERRIESYQQFSNALLYILYFQGFDESLEIKLLDKPNKHLFVEFSKIFNNNSASSKLTSQLEIAYKLKYSPLPQHFTQKVVDAIYQQHLSTLEKAINYLCSEEIVRMIKNNEYPSNDNFKECYDNLKTFHAGASFIKKYLDQYQNEVLDNGYCNQISNYFNRNLVFFTFGSENMEGGQNCNLADLKLNIENFPAEQLPDNIKESIGGFINENNE